MTGTDFPPDETDSLFEVIPGTDLFGTSYTAEQWAYLQERAMCPVCGARPDSLDPLPDGWAWDCVAFTNWCWCPKCDW